MLRFNAGRVDASNARSSSSGRYTVQDDMPCIAFEVNDWGHSCFYAFDGEPAAGAAPSAMVFGVHAGASSPLTIR